MDHYHSLILVGTLTPTQRQQFTAFIQESTCTWFNYTLDAWLVCSTNTSQVLLDRLQKLLASSTYFLVLSVDDARAIGGALPEEAWKWLRRHHLMPHLGTGTN